MKIDLKHLLISLFIIAGSSTFGQKGNVFVKNGKTPNTIKVKWFFDDLWHKEGVVFYRKEINSKDWIKLNQNPIKFGDYKITQKDLNNDESLKDFIELAKNVTPKENEGFIKLSLLLKSLLSEPFAKYIGILFIDSTARVGTSYQYKVDFMRYGVEDLFGVSDTIIAGNPPFEKCPQDIQFIPYDKFVTFKWKQEEERYFGVNIYRNNAQDTANKLLNPIPIVISKVTDSSGVSKYPDVFFLDSIDNYVNYYYQLTSIDFFGDESPFSQSYQVVSSDLTPPSPPYALMQNINNKEVKISWSIDPSPDHKGFIVYRDKEDIEPYQKLNAKILDAETRLYVDNVSECGGYYYYVSSVDTAGNERKSHKIFVEVKDITPPDAPQNFFAIADTGLIKLSWKANNEDDLMGYLVFRNISSNTYGEFNLLMSKPISENSFIDTLPKRARNKFLYKVVAIDSSFNISKPSNIANAQMPDIFPPEKPYIRTVYEKDNSIIIEWIGNVETDLAGYNVFRDVIMDSTRKTEQLNVNMLDKSVTRFTDRYANPNIQYEYYINVFDTTGNQSEISNLFPFKINKLITESIEILDFKIKAKPNQKYPSIAWKIKENDNFVGVVVYRKTDSSGFRPISKNISEIETTIKDEKDIIPGTLYHYQIRAYNKDGIITRSKEMQWLAPKVEE